jgi:hypothetical protein
MLLQLAFYQFPFQRSAARLTGRSIALFEQTAFPDPADIEVMRNGWQNEHEAGPQHLPFGDLAQPDRVRAAGRYDETQHSRRKDARRRSETLGVRRWP